MSDSRVSQPIRLMIVEDESIVAADLESLLTLAGYQVTGIADSGADALVQAREHPPDLALVDIRLRGTMDGIELAEKLRQELRVPVVFTTAHADRATLARARQTEPFGYVVKPFDMQSLQVAIEIARSRHNAEERVRQLERWLATTLESIGDAIIATDASGTINLVNAKAETLTGWSREEAVGRPLHDVLVVSGDRGEDLSARACSDALERGVEVHLSTGAYLQTRSGKPLPIDDSIAPIRDDRGAITGLVVIFRDRSALVEAEEERRRLELKMHEAQRLESLGVLAGGIAHDFNNLLTVTVGNAVICRGKLPADSELRGYLEDIEQAGRRGAELCAQMLAYAGKGRFVVRPVDLSSLVSESVRLLEISISKDAELTIDLAKDLPPVSADPSKLQQVVMNLLINASEALPGGRGKIRLSTAVVDLDAKVAAELEPAGTVGAGRYVRLEVRDTGIGMTDEAKSKLFDPFFTTKFQGRGLGLAAVRGILGAHHGGARVESTLGKGTVFQIFLPALVEVRAEPSEGPFEVGSFHGGGRALVADDDETVRLVASAMMGDLGFEVDSVSSGPEAIASLESDPSRYRIALLDLTMPRMGGIEVAEKIHDLAPDLPVLVMSGYGEESTKNAAASGSVSGFVPKPFTVVELKAKVAEALTGWKASDAQVELWREAGMR